MICKGTFFYGETKSDESIFSVGSGNSVGYAVSRRPYQESYVWNPVVGGTTIISFEAGRVLVVLLLGECRKRGADYIFVD